MTKAISLEELKETLIKRNRNGETWASIAHDYDVIPQILWKIAKTEYTPKKPETRKNLGLLEIKDEKLVRNERVFILPWYAYNFLEWLYWKWDRTFGMGNSKHKEKGFRLFGFTHIREWIL